MRKTTITINDPMQVKAGDKAYFKDCDFGFTVSLVDKDDTKLPFAVMTPLGYAGFWARSSRFDHATREVEEPEWPDPHDLKFHIYRGADDRLYFYNPTGKRDTSPWSIEGMFTFHSRRCLEAEHRDALPITELELVPKKRES